tara:strand:- start:178 stop:492 length:315 start_codon:yes stop_codon:yes gene_type:complete
VPRVARGDGRDIVATLHGCDSVTTCLGKSTNVFVNKIGVHRLSDLNTTHQVPCGNNCCSHSQPVVSASPNVIVNLLGVARVGDPYLECGIVASGSENVFANGVG